MHELGYSWQNRRRRSFFLPKSEHFGRWISIAIFLGVIFHFVLYLALTQIPVLIALVEGEKVPEPPSEMQMVEMPTRKVVKTPPPESMAAPPEEPVTMSKQLAELEDVMGDVEISPELDKTMADIKIESPAISGDSMVDDFTPVKPENVALEVPDIGKDLPIVKPTVGEVKVDLGKPLEDSYNPDKYLEDLMKKGSGGKVMDGALKDFTTLEQMKQLDGNALENAKALIGSDLLFEFGKAELKKSAKNSLMAVAFLIDRHPDMICVLEGHTDLFGDAEKNVKLSQERAGAVKKWLMDSLLLEEDRIQVLALGESKPLILDGDKEAQALNRRVVIKMQKQKVADPEIPKAVPVAPAESDDEEPPVQVIPRAVPVEP